MRDIAVILLAVIVLLAAFTSRFAGAMGYWWFSIFRPHEWIYTDISNWRLTMFATILFIVPCVLQGKFPSIRNPQAFLMILFLSVTSFASLLVGCEGIGIRSEYLFNFTTAIVATLFTIKVIDSKSKFFLLIAMIAAIISFHAGKAGLQSMLGLGGTFYGSSELGGMFTGSNAFALGSAVLLFLVLNCFVLLRNNTTSSSFIILRQFPIMTKVSTVILPLLILGIIFNVIALSSRGSALSMFGGIILWLWLSSFLKVKTIIVGTLLVIVLFNFVELPDGYSERLASAFADSETLDKSAASRPFFWGIALDIASDYPLGIGAGCYNSFYNFYDHSGGLYGSARTVHSSHFEVLAESGYFALIIWFLLFFISIKNCLTIRKNAILRGKARASDLFNFHTANMLIASITVFFVGSSFYAMSYNPILWLLFGMVAILGNLQARGKSPKTGR